MIVGKQYALGTLLEPLARLDTLQKKQRTLLVMIAVGAYVALFLPISILMGWVAAGVLELGPVVLSGRLLGPRAALIVGAFLFPINLIMLAVVGESPWTVTVLEGGGIAHLTIMMTGAVVGLTYDLSAQLKVQLAERERAEDQTRRSLDENVALLKELHHRVKNNMQIISSLLSLQSQQMKDEEITQMFRDSQDRIRAMALIYEPVFQSLDISRVDFGEYVNNLTSYLLSSSSTDRGAVKLKTSVNGVFLEFDAATSCGLILHELLSNALKHAFPGGREGEISVDLHVHGENRFSLVVSDNGVGLPVGLDFTNTKSLGLQMVNVLVEELDGSIEIDTSAGTTVTILFTEPHRVERR